MNLDKLLDPLPIESIDFRIQSINKGGYATILAYKDARVDMQRLDEAVGPTRWKRQHCRENHNCIVSIYDETIQQWISKEDTGTESNTEQQKGLASDSFKRACFNWGIGRELYDYPLIQIKLNGDGSDKNGEWIKEGRNGKPQATFYLRLKEWSWYSEFNEGKIVALKAKDQNGQLRFSWPEKPHPNSKEARKQKADRRSNCKLTNSFLEVFIGENSNPSSAAEAWREMSEEESKLVWKNLTSQEQRTLRTILSGNSECLA